MPIILGSDAHYMTSVGDFTNVQKLLDEVQMPDELIINTDTEAFKKFISLKRKIKDIHSKNKFNVYKSKNIGKM